MFGSADLFRLSQLSLGVAIAFLGVGVLPQQLLTETERLKNSTEKDVATPTSNTAQNFNGRLGVNYFDFGIDTE